MLKLSVGYFFRCFKSHHALLESVEDKLLQWTSSSDETHGFRVIQNSANWKKNGYKISCLNQVSGHTVCAY